MLGETFYLVGKHLGSLAEAQLAESLAHENYQLTAPTQSDLHRAAQLMGRYADLPLGGTDALIVATAERYEVFDVATLDRRHFSIVRPRHCEAFRILP